MKHSISQIQCQRTWSFSSVRHLGLSLFSGTCVCLKYHITVASKPTAKRQVLLRVGGATLWMAQAACLHSLNRRLAIGEKHAYQQKECLHVISGRKPCISTERVCTCELMEKTCISMKECLHVISQRKTRISTERVSMCDLTCGMKD